MRREAKILLSKAIDSLILAIELFNRPWDRGRQEGVLILTDRAFELLLKAAIVHRGGKIRVRGEEYTIGFDRCVRKCINELSPAVLTEEEALTPQIVNSLRDAAQHYFVDVSENQLYIYAQAALTLFADKLESVFGESLADYLPDRVLPISTNPPKELTALVELELDDIKRLVRPGSRRGIEAAARMRPLAIVEESLSGRKAQPTDRALKKLIDRVTSGEPWESIFPGVATLQLDTKGTGLSVSLRITKSEGTPVQLVREATAGATVVAVKRVNELDYYSLGLAALAQKLDLSQPKTLALVRHLKLQNSQEYYKEFVIGSVRSKRYSEKALHALRATIDEVDMTEVWRRHRPKSRRRRTA